MINKTSSLLLIRETWRENSTFVEKESVRLKAKRERKGDIIYKKGFRVFKLGLLQLGHLS